MQRRFLSLAFMAPVFFVCVSAFSACSGEGEGQRCSTLDDPAYNSPNTQEYAAGSSDCSGQYICWPASALGGLAATYAQEANDPTLGICCPYPRVANDSVSICATQTSAADAAPPVDASASDSPASDAPTSDAPTTDAPVSDAPASDAPTSDGAIGDAALTDDAADGAIAPIDAGSIADANTSGG